MRAQRLEEVDPRLPAWGKRIRSEPVGSGDAIVVPWSGISAPRGLVDQQHLGLHHQIPAGRRDLAVLKLNEIDDGIYARKTILESP